VSSIKSIAGRRPKKTYEQGRCCAHPECETVLSQYNKNTCCWRHFQPKPQPARIPAMIGIHSRGRY